MTTITLMALFLFIYVPLTMKTSGAFPPRMYYNIFYRFRIVACAAARRAMGTRKGEQDT